VDADETHRKTIRHIEGRRDGHHLTFSCVDRRPLLEIPGVHELLAESLTNAIKSHRFDLYAYVFMPEHVHIVVRPQVADGSIAALLQGIKKPMSFRARTLLESSDNPILATLIKNGRGRAAGFRFWQQGPGFDSNLRSWESVTDAIGYVHTNPVRRGLVTRGEEYRWSSCRQWVARSEPNGPHEVPVCRRKS